MIPDPQGERESVESDSRVSFGISSNRAFEEMYSITVPGNTSFRVERSPLDPDAYSIRGADWMMQFEATAVVVAALSPVFTDPERPLKIKVFNGVYVVRQDETTHKPSITLERLTDFSSNVGVSGDFCEIVNKRVSKLRVVPVS